MAVIDFYKDTCLQFVFTFYKDLFVQKQPPKGVLPKSVLTIFNNPMILLKISAEFDKNNCEGVPFLKILCRTASNFTKSGLFHKYSRRC